jgi:hypothetical protein
MLYKLLNEDGTTPQQGFQWPLPEGDAPGEWVPAIQGELVPCQNGYHVLGEEDLLAWRGACLYVIETRGDIARDTDKFVCREARLLRRVEAWTDTILRLFAADCAERVVHLCGDDPRPRAAIEAARQFARGQIDVAARDAAGAAAWDAAGAAARDAAGAAAGDAAWAAARDAARDAAWAAAWAAAWDAAWDAAWAAARAAAWAAARAAAGAAARDAAWAAARDAAWDAAWDAERAWQLARLQAYLSGQVQ